MNIQGYYKITIGDKIIRGHNLITFLGESFFLHRMIDNEFNPIEYIVLGNSNIQVKKSDLSLGNETVRKKCVTKADLENKQIYLECSCTTKEIINTSEIGVATDTALISHDIYENISTDFIGNNVDTVEIQYIFDLSTLNTRSDWVKYTQINTGSTDYNIYCVSEENLVKGVIEEDSNGYHAVSSLNDLKTRTGAYYYNVSNKMLFIRTIRTDNPNNYKISIITK